MLLCTPISSQAATLILVFDLGSWVADLTVRSRSKDPSPKTKDPLRNDFLTGSVAAQLIDDGTNSGCQTTVRREL
jgi:hypothetical protein